MKTNTLAHWTIQWWKTLFILVLVAWLSLTPGDAVPKVRWFAHQDKAVHLLMYLALSYTLYWDSRASTKHRRALSVVLAAAAYGALMEGLQYFTGYRSAEWLDVLANTTGATLGALAHKYLHARIGLPFLHTMLHILPTGWQGAWRKLWQL